MEQQTNTTARPPSIETEPLQAEFERPVDPTEILTPQGKTSVMVGEVVDQWIDEAYIVQFEQQIKRHKRLMSAILALTNESHWIAMGKGKYYLQAPGCEALLKPLGISYGRRGILEKPEISRERKYDANGEEFYAYWVEGWAASSAMRQEGFFIGYCDSRDQFFNARPGWTPETGDADIKKSAMSNWIVNAVTRLAGIRSPDPQMLTSANLDLTRIQGVDYSGRKTMEGDTGKISEGQTKRLFAISRAKKIETDLLKVFLRECHSYERSDDVLLKDYEVIIKEIEGGPSAVKGLIEQAQAKKASPPETTTTEREPGGDDA